MPVEDTSALAPLTVSPAAYMLQTSGWGKGIIVISSWHLCSQIMKSALDIALQIQSLRVSEHRIKI